MALKTLHLTNAFHPQSGGISTFYRAMLQAANEQQRPMCLVVPGVEDSIELVGSYGKIYFVRARPAPLNGSYRCIYPTQFLYADSPIRKILRAERPDVIEICDKYNLLYLGGLIRVGLLRDLDFRPLMLGLSCERMDENVKAYVGSTPFHRWFCRWYMHWIYFTAFDHHTAVSEHAAVELVAAARGHAVERGIWIRPMGVDAGHFSPDRRSTAMRTMLLNRAGGRDDSTLLLYAGRLAPEKNLPLLIEMLHCLEHDGRDYRLLVVGDGTERQHLQTLAGDLLHGNVCFLEHITDREQLSAVYASCDLFVHPNPREPFGIAPLEAMASGLPLVGPNLGGITSFANDGNAWLAAPEGNAFAAAVQQALNNDVQRSVKVENALQTAADHSWDRTARAYFALYDDLHARFWGLGQQAGAPPYACSSPANSFSDAVGRAFALVAQTVFRTTVRVKDHGPARRLAAARGKQPVYVPEG